MAFVQSDDDIVRFTAAAALTCGQAIVVSDRRVGIVQNMKPVAIGEVATCIVEGAVKMTAAATMSAGAQVGVHITNQTLVAAGTAGSVPAGTLLYDVTSGAVGEFSLNEFAKRSVSVGASTAAAGSTYADAGALPAGTAAVYLTSAADGTKGVIIDVADQVLGRKLYIANGVSNAVLKVYGPAGAAINGAAANAAFSSVSGKGVIIICTSATGNTWSAF